MMKKERINIIMGVFLFLGIVIFGFNIYAIIHSKFELIAFTFAIIFSIIAFGLIIITNYEVFLEPFEFNIGIFLLIGSPIIIILTEGLTYIGILLIIVSIIMGLELISPKLILKYIKNKSP